jgi:hypothetical protein
LDKKKKSAVSAVLLGARPLADNLYSWTGRQSARQNRQQIKPHWTRAAWAARSRLTFSAIHYNCGQIPFKAFGDINN